MKITAKMTKDVLGVLDDLILEIQKEQKKPYPYAEWERKRKKVKEKLKKLPEYTKPYL